MSDALNPIDPIRIALPSKGHLYDGIVEIMAAAREPSGERVHGRLAVVESVFGDHRAHAVEPAFEEGSLHASADERGRAASGQERRAERAADLTRARGVRVLFLTQAHLVPNLRGVLTLDLSAQCEVWLLQEACGRATKHAF